MDVKKREWRVNPPRREVDTLEGLVFDFKWRFPRERRDMVVEYCKAADSLPEAVRRACASRAAPAIGGKMHNHQSRVPEAVRTKFAENILILEADLYHVQEFDELFDLLEAAVVPGIGPVTLYDVATRVGAWLTVEPTSLYLHAGVRQGVASLLAALPRRSAGPIERVTIARSERLTVEQLHHHWPEFDDMTPDEVEDFLCTYRLVFADLAPEGGS